MSNLVLLGIVIGAYGVRGQVRLRSFASSPCDIGIYGCLRDSSGREYEVSSPRSLKGDVVVCHLSGIDSRNLAESMVGVELFISRSVLGGGGDDSYYHVDLIGLGVFSESGESLGEVVNVCNYGGGDLLEIRNLSGVDILLLFSRENVLSIGEIIILSAIGVEALGYVAG